MYYILTAIVAIVISTFVCKIYYSIKQKKFIKHNQTEKRSCVVVLKNQTDGSFISTNLLPKGNELDKFRFVEIWKVTNFTFGQETGYSYYINKYDYK